jgi:hypothetical protein
VGCWFTVTGALCIGLVVCGCASRASTDSPGTHMGADSGAGQTSAASGTLNSQVQQVAVAAAHAEASDQSNHPPDSTGWPARQNP